MLMGLANLDGSFTGTIYMDNDEGDECFAQLEKGPAAAQAFLEEHYASALPALGGAEAAGKQLCENGRGILGTVRAKQWAAGKQVVLVGDAAHAIVPFFGQGMNSGFVRCLFFNTTPPSLTGRQCPAAALIFGQVHPDRA